MKKMTQTWIIFSIDDQQVYQMPYNGCTGQDDIDGWKVMVAEQNNVPEKEVKVSFSDDLMKAPAIKNLKTKEIIVSSELMGDVIDEMTKDTFQN